MLCVPCWIVSTEWFSWFSLFFLSISECSLLTFFISETFTEVKVVAVFDAMMSGLPTHKEDFNGYCFWTQGTILVVTTQWKSWLVLWFFFFLGWGGQSKTAPCTVLLHVHVHVHICECNFTSCFQHPHFVWIQCTSVITLSLDDKPEVKGL